MLQGGMERCSLAFCSGFGCIIHKAFGLTLLSGWSIISFVSVRAEPDPTRRDPHARSIFTG